MTKEEIIDALFDKKTLERVDPRGGGTQYISVSVGKIRFVTKSNNGNSGSVRLIPTLDEVERGWEGWKIKL